MPPIVEKFLLQSLHAVDPWEWAVMVVNIILLFAAERIFRKFSTRPDDQRNNLVKVFRAINALILLWLVFSNVVLRLEDESLVSQVISAIMAFYIGYLTYLVYAHFINQKFGQVRTIDDRQVAVETYNSRALRLLGGILILVITLISIVQIFGLKGLMEAGGVIGFLGVMLALTQGAWAPDLISGLIILNSDIVRQGDVIEIEGDKGNYVAVVFRIKLFHCEVLDVVSNHRIMIKNANFRDMTLHNLSRFASARGLREKLTFNIGYDVDQRSVVEMFEAAFAKACDPESLSIEEQYPPEIRVMETGDDAVTYGFFYYTKDVKQVVATRQAMRQLILVESKHKNIVLATPRLLDVTTAMPPQPGL